VVAEMVVRGKEVGQGSPACSVITPSTPRNWFTKSVKGQGTREDKGCGQGHKLQCARSAHTPKGVHPRLHNSVWSTPLKESCLHAHTAARQPVA